MLVCRGSSCHRVCWKSATSSPSTNWSVVTLLYKQQQLRPNFDLMRPSGAPGARKTSWNSAIFQVYSVYSPELFSSCRPSSFDVTTIPQKNTKKKWNTPKITPILWSNLGYPKPLGAQYGPVNTGRLLDSKELIRPQRKSRPQKLRRNWVIENDGKFMVISGTENWSYLPCILIVWPLYGLLDLGIAIEYHWTYLLIINQVWFLEVDLTPHIVPLGMGFGVECRVPWCRSHVSGFATRTSVHKFLAWLDFKFVSFSYWSWLFLSMKWLSTYTRLEQTLFCWFQSQVCRIKLGYGTWVPLKLDSSCHMS